MTERLDSIDALDFSRYVRRGDMVIWGQACAEPRTLTSHLMAQRACIGHFSCFLGIPASDTVNVVHADHIAFVSYCGSGGNRVLHRAGVLDVIPVHYSYLPDLFQSGTIAIDVALVQLAPPDSAGRYSLGLAADYLIAAIDAARVVIAEVNDQVPQTPCGRLLTESELDVIIHTSCTPATVQRATPTHLEQRIAAQVASLIEDGATLQFGIGKLPEAILAQLVDHRDLGVHSGIINDTVVDLMEAGVVTNARKSLDHGKTVTGLLMGSQRLFAYAHHNSAIELRETRYTHNPEVLAAQAKFVAINSAIEVDLFGQVNAEVADGQYIGAVGGATDFLRGAARSQGGLPIVAIPSQRIVAHLSGPVSLARSDAGLVVTECGVADLRGQSLRERRRRLLAIAHPDDQAALEQQGDPI